MIPYLTKYSLRITIPLLVALLTTSFVLIGSFIHRKQMHETAELEAHAAFKEKIARSQENLELLLREGHQASLKQYISSFSISIYNVISFLVDENQKVFSATDSEYIGQSPQSLFQIFETPFDPAELRGSEIKIKRVVTKESKTLLHGTIEICGTKIDFTPAHLRRCGYFYSITDITPKLASVNRAIWREILVSTLFAFLGSAVFIYIINLLVTLRARTILQVAREYQRGWTQARVKISGNDEIAIIAKGLNDTFNKIEANERVLLQTANSLAKAQQIVNMGNWIWDLDTNDLYWSDQIYRIFGMEPGEIKPDYDAFMKFVHPEDIEEVTTAIQTALQNDASYRVQHRIVTKEGETRFVEESGELQKDDSGKNIEMHGVITDITEKVRTQEDLELYRQMIEATGDPVFMIDDDDDCRMIFVNEAAVKHFGAPREEILKWRIPDWDPNFTYEHLDEHVKEVKAIKNLFIESQHRRKSGEIVPVEISINHILYNGRVCHFGYFHDISQRKHQEEELKTAQKNLAEINRTFLTFGSDHTENMNKITALAGEIFNGACALYNRLSDGMLCSLGVWNAPPGYNPLDKPDGHICYDIIQDAPEEAYVVNDLQNSPYAKSDPNVTSYHLETYVGHVVKCYNKPVGSLCIVFQEGVEFTDNQLKILGILASALGLEEERKADEAEIVQARIEAETANRAKSEFLANMSHEIRTPMNAIMGFTEILEKRITGAREKKYLGSIKSGSTTLLRLINDILDLSKVEAGKMVLEYDYFNVANMFDEIYSMFSEKALEKDVLFEVKKGVNIPESVYLDEIRVRQIIINLVSNAIKFTEAGSVTLSCAVSDIDAKEKKLTLEFSVKDTGIGISKGDLNNIFEAFSQQAGQSVKYGGTGLGLTISKQLANMMNGDIEAESERHKGSEFKVIFKEIAFQEWQPEKENGEETEEVIFEPAALLIVDDIESNRDLIRSYFEDSPLDFIQAVNGREAVAYAREYRPDLIIMDLRMPIMDGYEATLAIKNDPETKDIPLVIASASGMEQRIDEMKPIIEGYIRKPFNKSKITEILKQYLPYTVGERERGNVDDSLVVAEEGGGDIMPENGAEVLEKIAAEVMVCESLTAELDFIKLKEYAQKVNLLAGELKYGPFVKWAQSFRGATETFDVDDIKKLSRRLSDLKNQMEERLYKEK